MKKFDSENWVILIAKEITFYSKVYRNPSTPERNLILMKLWHHLTSRRSRMLDKNVWRTGGCYHVNIICNNKYIHAECTPPYL